MSSQNTRVLLVDDDASIREAVCEYLALHQFHVKGVPDVRAMEAALRTSNWDLIILDLMMPGEDGLSACRRVFDKCPPILILSALGGTIDRIVGLEAGACDYLPKPFEPRELLARIRALLRLSGRPKNEAAVSNFVVFEGWQLNSEDRILLDPRGKTVQLSPGEFELLEVLVARPGRLLSRETLLDLTRGREADTFDRAVDLAISRLRNKLRQGGTDDIIETVRGAGYRFRSKVELSE